ncbi:MULTISPECIES: flagellar biosynthetic protein FliR [unclassified Lentilitoribacter]|uniref:flagellar biosynthetic protein FliR n=1 Tax=unclassified Lentilitoribacter TaxID=2647570 RepID=UPI0013A6EA1F|nr:flagellar biosynthetic protein FliR [Lentilitoribacter sp. Alg239-R112]
MIADPEGTVLALFAAFCRIGGCFMALPGLSSARIPVQIRLMIALAVSMAILPLMWEMLYAQTKVSGGEYIILIGGEIFVGVTMGLIARYITLGLQFAGTAMSMTIGYNAAPSPGIVEYEPESDITTIISFTAIVLLFMTDFHHMIIQTLVRSYEFMPIGGGFQNRMALVSLTDTLASTFILMLSLASPFIIYGLIFNLSIGMVNKLAPQIPIYFISIPFILTGGLILLYLGISDFLILFMDGFFRIFEGQ